MPRRANGKSITSKAPSASSWASRYAASNSREACQRHSKRLLGLDTIQNHPNHALQLRIFRFGALHEPAEHVLIFASQQPDVEVAVHLIERRVYLFGERHQQHIQLQHAATAVPVEAIDFYIFDHGALLKSSASIQARRHRTSRLWSHH